jgi:hypothetical protein
MALLGIFGARYRYQRAIVGTASAFFSNRAFSFFFFF